MDMAGRLEEHRVTSELLAGNPLGDPHERPLWVYTPPGYDEDTERRCPTIYLLQGLTGQLDMWRNRASFRKNVPELVDELFASAGVPPCIVVWVDCWTSVGGSQFLSSPATGQYHHYLCDEIVPWVDSRFRTLADRAHRGVAGHSSGGYGAMVTPMLRPDLFAGLATHSGDSLFETCYLPTFRESARVLRTEYDGSFERFWQDFRSRPAFSRESDANLLNDYCMAAAYSADTDGSVHVPYDTATGELDLETWQRWLDWDPVRMAPRHADALKGMRAIYIDAGSRDQYYLDLGAFAFHRVVQQIGAAQVFFELFDATHSAVEYRFSTSLRYLAERLA
jgi:S-formylglutathione hydrolase FrmB